jgi:hypothetical protein
MSSGTLAKRSCAIAGISAVDSIRITSISSSTDRESHNTEGTMGLVLIVERLCLMIRTRSPHMRLVGCTESAFRMLV